MKEMAMNFPLLNNLNTILAVLRANFLTIGLTLAGLIGAIAIIGILLNHDVSPVARSQRWEKLILVFICVGLLAGLLAFIAFAQSIGKGLGA